MKNLKVKITFTQSVLGTQTGDKDIYRSFIGSKSPDANTIEDEVASVGVDEVVEKGKTWFPKLEDGTPFIYDYQIKGFFKSACSAMRMATGSKSKAIKAYKKVIDLCVFIDDRKNKIENITEITECQRPLRAQTMQGERISIAISEEINAGSTCTFGITILDDTLEELVKEWLNYGRYNGFLQWRNSGKGSFRYELLDENGNTVGGNKDDK
jgi:hypothetical protein